MRFRVGTSGFSYKEWRGRFYPEELKPAEWLSFYAERFDSVEINNTFYRMPKAEQFERWRDQVGDGFAFVVKAPQRITHRKRLKDAAEDVAYLAKGAASLGDRLGPVLFQLPPYLRRDDDRLSSFLACLPPGMRAAFEFRHESWNDDNVYTALRNAGAAVCVADVEDAPAPPLVATADWTYLRLRRCDYSDADLADWAEKIEAAGVSEAWVFFKHEDEATGPDLAMRWRTLTQQGR
jgi:uncharacterized protein YecE (DUF72 family)